MVHVKVTENQIQLQFQVFRHQNALLKLAPPPLGPGGFAYIGKSPKDLGCTGRCSADLWKFMVEALAWDKFSDHMAPHPLLGLEGLSLQVSDRITSSYQRPFLGTLYCASCPANQNILSAYTASRLETVGSDAESTSSYPTVNNYFSTFVWDWFVKRYPNCNRRELGPVC